MNSYFFQLNAFTHTCIYRHTLDIHVHMKMHACILPNLSPRVNISIKIQNYSHPLNDWFEHFFPIPPCLTPHMHASLFISGRVLSLLPLAVVFYSPVFSQNSFIHTLPPMHFINKSVFTWPCLSHYPWFYFVFNSRVIWTLSRFGRQFR